MRLRIGLFCALIAASCAPARRAEAPAPLPAAAPSAPRPVPAPVTPLAKPAVESVAVSPPIPVAPADSVALAKLARDSLLDAAMLDRLATAAAPEEPASVEEAEAATLRTMFDIDVVNWTDHARVKYFVDFFTGPARERMAIWLTRMPRFEPTIRTLLMARGLPGDLAYLPLIESGYSSTAVSRARAVGMWQFMPKTGKFYGLKIDSWVDERRDVVKATDAAIRYLGDLTTMFGSPYLAAAAYNGGPGRIQRGLARIELPVEDEVDDSTADEGVPQAGDAAFFQLADTRYIRRETKDYVPKLIAAALIAKQPERYGFPSVQETAPFGIDSIVVEDATGLDVIARLAGVPLADLWAENPSYIRAVTPPKRRAVVRVPSGSGSATQLLLDSLPAAERLTGFAHHAKSGETLSRIAKRYGVSLSSLSGANPELKGRAPRSGEVIRIPGQARLAGWINENRRVNEVAGGITHKVRKGETLGLIAARYRTSVARLRSWNNLSSRAVLRIGQVLRVAPRESSSSGASASGKRVHVVKAGETLSGLARRFGVTLQSLRNANNLPAGRQLQRGQRLTIPS